VPRLGGDCHTKSDTLLKEVLSSTSTPHKKVSLGRITGFSWAGRL